MAPARRLLSLTAATAALAGTGILAVPGAAHASGPSGSVTVFLAAPNYPGLQRLADTNGLSHAQRVSALKALVPSSATVHSVSSELGAIGLTVRGATAWSLTASGPQSAIDAAFGTRPVAVAHPTAAQFRAETGALPQLPASLRSDVIAAFPATGGPAVFHSMADTALAGSDFRNAYTGADVTPPGSGASDDGDSTVATLQLAGYNSSDLTTYAANNHLANIVGTSRYQPVDVDGEDESYNPMDSDGDIEVDLDQESILSTAPSVTERPYFAPNTNPGFDDVFANAFDDVVQNSHKNGNGNPHITALSSSWGGCESGFGGSAIKAVETVVTALDAAGVTVFASSGDDGIYDCGDQTLTGVGPGSSGADVDYPASSPEVVGVGGTNLQYTGASSAPNNGKNWAETVWSCTSSVSCENTAVGTGGGGGGESGEAYDSTASDPFKGFAEPAYQSETVADKPFTHQLHRMVPDISADADPETGFEVYSSDPEGTALGIEEGNGNIQVGGTSLASPISAALLTNALAGKGVHTGVGDVHSALYSAYHDDPTATFRDVTSGTNGDTANKAGDPSVSAQKGYDTASGLGGALWSSLTPYLLSTGTPTSAASIKLATPHRAATPRRVKASWVGGRNGDDILPASTAVTITAAGTKKLVYSAPAAPVTGSRTFTGKPGTTYTITTVTSDLSGHVSTPAKARVVVPIDDRSFHFHKKWHHNKGPGQIGGSHAITHIKGATARVTATGRSYRLAVVVGPGRGLLTVRHGHSVRTVNLYAAHAGERIVKVFGSSSTKRAARTFTIRCLHRKSAASSSTAIAIDGMYVAA